jgi:hypothetical protein
VGTEGIHLKMSPQIIKKENKGRRKPSLAGIMLALKERKQEMSQQFISQPVMDIMIILFSFYIVGLII